jgi:hypothetical protein
MRSTRQNFCGVKLSSETSVLLAKVAFLLIMIAGVWLVFAETLHSGWRVIVVGVLLAIAGILLIVATHWGQFGKSTHSGDGPG